MARTTAVVQKEKMQKFLPKLRAIASCCTTLHGIAELAALPVPYITDRLKEPLCLVALLLRHFRAAHQLKERPPSRATEALRGDHEATVLEALGLAYTSRYGTADTVGEVG